MSEVKNVQTISKERYLMLLEDSAILGQIEFLAERKGNSVDNFLDSVKDILQERKMSRYDSQK